MSKSPAAADVPCCQRLLTAGDDAATCQRVDAALQALGWPPAAPWRGARHQGGASADLLLACTDAASLVQALDGEAAGADRPLLLFGPAPSVPQVQALAACGVLGWWPVSVLDDPAAASAVLHGALAHARARQQQQQALLRARRELDERKWIDRAKGVLMSAHGLDEQSAFGLLRGAAMQANLRLGEVSRAVTENAGWAEALNRAGQLRALSQRLVKLAVQRWAGVETRQARQAQDEALARLADNLRHLADLPGPDGGPAPWADALARTDAAGRALVATLQERLGAAMLRRADAQADALLACAESLSAALEQASGRRALGIVNDCGRQRMRAQRIAKQALLAWRLDDVALRDGLPAMLDDFEAVLRSLDAAPLSSTEIRQSLASARDGWLRMLRGLHGMHTEAGRLTITQAGDALLTDFERLTAAFEHSLQVLLA